LPLATVNTTTELEPIYPSTCIAGFVIIVCSVGIVTYNKDP